MIKLYTEDGIIYIRKDMVNVVENFKEEGIETETMEKATNHVMNIYLNDGSVVTFDTTNSKLNEKNLKILGGIYD